MQLSNWFQRRMIILYLVILLIFSKGCGGDCGFNDELHLSTIKAQDDLDNNIENAIESKNRRNTCWYNDYNNKIPYYFHGAFSQRDRKRVKEQMRKIKQNTCISFREMSNNEIHTTRHKLRIFRRNKRRCDAAKVWTERPEVRMRFSGPNCPPALIMHELGHVLGLLHTHKRHDRNEYINVDQNCVETLDKERDFDPLGKYDAPTHDIDYQCNSIMHYPNYKEWPCKPITEGRKSNCKNGRIGYHDFQDPLPEDWDLINKEHCYDGVRNNCRSRRGHGGGGGEGAGAGGGGGTNSSYGSGASDASISQFQEEQNSDPLWKELVGFYKLIKTLQ